MATIDELSWEDISGWDDPEQRFRIYRLCPGETDPELVATCATEAAVGVTLCTLGREGEFDPGAGDCAIGILDTEGEVGRKWIVRPWLASPKNVSDAAKVMATAGKKRRRKA